MSVRLSYVDLDEIRDEMKRICPSVCLVDFNLRVK